MGLVEDLTSNLFDANARIDQLTGRVDELESSNKNLDSDGLLLYAGTPEWDAVYDWLCTTDFYECAKTGNIVTPLLKLMSPDLRAKFIAEARIKNSR